MMTVDVEDYFQVSAFENVIPRDNWNKYQLRVEKNTHRILELFSKYEAKATFFVLGWVAERSPDLVREIVEQGHELASHGYDHKRVTNLSPSEFKSDISKSKDILEQLGGVTVNGYRAPSYSIVANNLWAHEVLAECGYRYSSSIYPIKHDHYGIPDAPRFGYRTGVQDLIEFPISTIKKFGRNFPCGGGGFFRLYPYTLSKWAISTVNRIDQEECIFYFHPWEMDPDQPTQENLPLKTRFRHYLNLDKTEKRLEKLLRDFQWVSMDSLLHKFDASEKG